MRHPLIVLAGVIGLVGVMAGTFGAHGLKGRLSPEMLEIFETGVRYHLFHALGLLGVAAVELRIGGRPLRAAGWAFALGVALFSGSLYVLALTGQKWLGMIAPIGGLAFMVGWLLVAVSGWRSGDTGDRAAVRSD